MVSLDWLRAEVLLRTVAINPPNFKLQTIAPLAPPAVIAGTTIRVLTDQELLDLFQRHLVALIGTPGKQS